MTPALLAVFLVLSCIFCLYLKYIRPRFPVRVHCWFCGGETRVPHGNKNCWDCPHCDQYNGFNEDGDYNKPIPAQYDSCMNFPITCVQDEFISRGNILCERCTNNQALKVKQLASFVPMHEADYDREIEAFRQHVETVYRLCYRCQSTVDRELDKQDYLLQSKLDKMDHKIPTSPQAGSGPQSHWISVLGNDLVSAVWSTWALEKILELLTLVITLALLCRDVHYTLPLQKFLPQKCIPLKFLPLNFLHEALQLSDMDYVHAAMVGCSLSILTMLLAGKNRLHQSEILTIPLWTSVILISQGFLHYGILPWDFVFKEFLTCSEFLPSLKLLLLICNVGNFLVTLHSLLVSRSSNTTPALSIRRLSLDTSRNTSQHSDTSAFTSVSHTFAMPTYVPQNSRVSHDPSVHHVSYEMPAGASKIDDTLTELEAFSLGSISRTSSTTGVFNSSFISSSRHTDLDPSKSLRSRRPLISPAKFSVLSKSTSTPSKKSCNSVSGHEPFMINKGPKLSPKSENLFLMRPSLTSSRKLFDMTSRSTQQPLDSQRDMTPYEKMERLSQGPSQAGIQTQEKSRQLFGGQDKGERFDNDMEDFHDDWSQGGRTTPSVCPVDSTTKGDITQAKGGYLTTPLIIGLALGASVVGNIVLVYTVYK